MEQFLHDMTRMTEGEKLVHYWWLWLIILAYVFLFLLLKKSK